MRSLASALRTHLQGRDHTVAICVRFTRRDGQVFGFTEHDRPLVVAGVLYSPLTAVQASDLTTGADLAVDNMNVTGAFDAAGITEGDVAAGLWDGASFVVFEVNWQSVGDGTHELKRGELGDLSYSGLGYEASLVGLTAKLQNNVGRFIVPTCDARFGDGRCKFPKASVTVVGVLVTAVASQTQLTLGSLAQAAGYFDEGELTGTAGANAGVTRDIKQHVAGGILTLHAPLPFVVMVGDVFTIAPGCRKRLIEDCRDRWDNVINHRGFDQLPGTDALLRGAR